MEHDVDSALAELGLAPGATEREVKAAWRRLVSQWHPDRNDSAAAVARMQRINRAVEAIRRAGFRNPAPAPGSSAAADDGAAADPGAGGRPARTIRRKVKVTLEEAAFGCTRVLRGKVTESCSACAGAGYRVLGGHCPRCHGSGAIRQGLWFGWAGAETECEACHGGGIAREVCVGCSGTGKSESQRYTVTVRLPHGVRNGDVLGVEGHRGRPGPLPGDLAIRVEVQPHALLALDEDGTLRCDVPVDGFAWIANRSVDVPTLDGLQAVQLQRGQLDYRLKGQGFPVGRRGPRGDQVVTVTPMFPQRISTDQQILLEQLVATTSRPDAARSDDRLRAWQQALRAWQRGTRGRG